MEYIISPIFCLLDLLFHSLFWDSFLEPKSSKKRQRLTFLLGWIACYLFVIIAPTGFSRQLLSYCFLLLFSISLFHAPLGQRLVLVTLGYGLHVMIESAVLYGAMTLTHLSYSEFIWQKNRFTVTFLIEKLSSLFFIWLFWSTRQKNVRKPTDKRWIFLSLLYPFTSLISIFFVFYSYQDKPDLSVHISLFSLILIVANIATVYLIRIMEKRTIEAEENALLHQQMEIQTESILALEKNYRSQRQFVHNFKNQLQTVYDLLSQDQFSEAMQYIENLQGMQTTRIFPISSRHPIIDAVLNHKYQTAKENDIDCQMQVNDLSAVQLSTDVLVVILSNLLDNAIEACCRLPDHRTIECTILTEKSFFLSIRNTSPPVAIHGSTIPTTKFPKENHGYGLPAVQHLLRNLHAESTFCYENGWFQFVAEIPNP